MVDLAPRLPSTPATLEEARAVFPWPARLRELAARHAPVEFLWHYDLAASADWVWSQVIDTSRLNRALGLGPMSFQEDADGRLLGRSRAGGVRHEWVEMPWSWVWHRTLVAGRDYARGLSCYAHVGYGLEEPSPGATRFTVYFAMQPRGWLARVLLRVFMPRVRKRYGVVLRDIAATAESTQPAELVRTAPPLAPERRERLATARQGLLERGQPAACVDALCGSIERDDDLELHRLRVRALARRWGVDPRALLCTCLHATRVGLLELSWDVICPHCRGVRAGVESLGDIPRRASCAPCAAVFGTDHETAIEITFRIHPAVREVPSHVFCSAEVAQKRHVKLQQALDPGEQRTLQAALAPGHYRLRLRGREGFVRAEVSPGGATHHAWRADAPLAGDELGLAPDVELALVGAPGDATSFLVEDVGWADDALRPVHLFNLQEFRDLFSREYLGAGVQLSIGEQTVLFTDIVGSTRMYATCGDPEAFVLVRQHFTEVFRIVGEHEGAVVKTIGDATMAAFGDAAQAVRAAVTIQRRFAPACEPPDLRLRVSLNTGVCIAVNLNSGIDYFGSTVNVAAKLQALAGAGEVVLAAATVEHAGVARALEELGLHDHVEAVSLAAKAFDTPVAACRFPVFATPEATHSRREA